MDLFDIITRFVLPPALGAGGGLIAALIGWDIEKRRGRRANREKMVAAWREALLTKFNPTGWAGRQGPRYEFMMLPEYASLRPHLSARFLKEIEGDGIVIAGPDFPRLSLISEIARIEKEWDLI